VSNTISRQPQTQAQQGFHYLCGSKTSKNANWLLLNLSFVFLFLTNFNKKSGFAAVKPLKPATSLGLRPYYSPLPLLTQKTAETRHQLGFAGWQRYCITHPVSITHPCHSYIRV